MTIAPPIVRACVLHSLLLYATTLVADDAAGEGSPTINVTEIVVTRLDGTSTSPASYPGQVVLVDLWATWCAPCQRSLPFYADLHDRYHAEGLVVLAISVDESRRDLQRFLEQSPLPFDVAWDGDQSIVAQLAPGTMPTAYLIDREGHVRYVQEGFRVSDRASFEALVVTLLAEPPGAP